jgi:release factor glutamine methyltransferase
MQSLQLVRHSSPVFVCFYVAGEHILSTTMTYLESLCERLLAEKYQGEKSSAYEEDCRRLQKGEPYEYVLGFVDFLGARIDLSLRPMIPRPETAFWVTHAIEELKEKKGTLRLADTFAGSGNIGLALLQNLPNATVDISELDPALKSQIEKNIGINTIAEERVRVVTASGLDGLVGQYDAIFAVPPYIPYEALPELDREMIEFEPHLAFFAHENGHEFHKMLITEACDLLAEGGTLYMEADMDHNDAIRALVQETKWSKLEFWPDPYGATPNVVLRK